MRRRQAALGMALVAAWLAAGCLVEVREVRDPRPAFDAAREAAARVQGRPGPARHLNVLAYDPEGHELTRVSLPMWLACRAARDGDFELDRGHGEAEGRVRERLRGENLRKLPLGVLVEVSERDGGRALVWLD